MRGCKEDRDSEFWGVVRQIFLSAGRTILIPLRKIDKSLLFQPQQTR